MYVYSGFLFTPRISRSLLGSSAALHPQLLAFQCEGSEISGKTGVGNRLLDCVKIAAERGTLWLR